MILWTGASRREGASATFPRRWPLFFSSGGAEAQHRTAARPTGSRPFVRFHSGGGLAARSVLGVDTRSRTMPLTLEKLEEIQAENFAEDVAIDVGAMQHWSEEEAHEYFSTGGEKKPTASTAAPDPIAPGSPSTVAHGDDLTLDDEDLDGCPQPVFQQGGGDTSMVAKEADKETDRSGLEAPASKRGGGMSAVAPPPASADFAQPEGAGEAASDGRPVAKAVLVGNSGVGKTSLMLRFTQDLFRENSRATIGVDLQTRAVQIGSSGKTLNLQLWDTAGQEQFASLTASFFRNAHAVLLAYDVHDKASFAALQRWMVEVDRHAPAEVVKSIVGLKADGDNAATAVVEAEAATFAAKHGALCARCSARDGAHVTPLFEELAAKVVRNGFDADGTRAARRASKGGGGSGVKLGAKSGGGKKKGGCC